MAKDSLIAWTDHTFSPWWGCTKVSPACDHCYAEMLSTRWHRGAWGKDTARWFPSEAYWAEPVKWNRKATSTGTRARVFSASMGDVLEDRGDLRPHRERLWWLIADTPMLDWLLLTKRPVGYRTMMPPEILALPNVWPGVTVERADYTWRLNQLVQLPAAGPRWVSYEPALGPVDFAPWLPAVSWIIVGGESGPQARPFDLQWARQIIAQCRAAGAAPFVKQLGSRRWRTGCGSCWPTTTIQPCGPTTSGSGSTRWWRRGAHVLRFGDRGDQAGIPPAAAGQQLRRFPRALRLDDLLVEPDDEPRRGDSTRPETTKEEPTPAERELLTIKQLVAYSTLSERTLRGYMKRRSKPLPHYQVDKKILVRRTTFDEWLANFRRGDGGEVDRVVEEIFSGLTGARPRPNTRAHLTYAVEERLIPVNPMVGGSRLWRSAPPPETIDPFTGRELRAILEAAVVIDRDFATLLRV